ncbi:MAG: hypothetical protein KatS3mg015_2374 [Fimbriimonadales bacterium]|nr:MAG: hypothetical protein KatS3mg015_2374 [Fimbriimonadales bacterium]
MKYDWLNLIEVSGPFLAVPVLDEVFPQGLEALEPSRAQRLRRAYDEWREAVDADDPHLEALHAAWIDEVLTTALEMDANVLRRGDALPVRLRVARPEHGVTLAPDLALVDPHRDDAPLLLVHVLEPEADLERARRFGGLVATPAERMVTLLRATGCPLGLVTNGERWMLVHAPVGSVATFASWYARLWGQEPETLRAFVSLLGVRRAFGPEHERLPALFERSLKHQDEVTDALGEQVRRAVEVLVQALDRADQDRNRELLRDVPPRELYEAALTVMMRLVFLLSAEERGLLLLNDERYDAHYAVSTLRMQLRAETEEILERRRSAWSRLLALFRAVYGGVEHPALRLPALGGSLFDPDRYPFLEGRKPGTSWRTHPAEPLPIDDRTVLLLLEAIQTFEGRTLSYRALDVEQIGHVYEGLLERTVARVDDVTLELEAAAKAKDPRVTLGELESAALDDPKRVEALLTERSGRSASAIRNALDRAPDDRLAGRLLTVCRGDVALRDRILPYAHLLRTDPWGYPLVHHAGAFVVVLGTDRRETGTHYTPKSLTERIVEETLTPLVYRGPAEGKPREDWELKRPDELLDLKVCDPAMGSGAFLVQVCRYLSERLVEAWAREEAAGRVLDAEGRVRHPDEDFEPLPADVEERAIVARRLVAERCLYGVDLNPLAVELAKLSLWLTTLAKGRPFEFLDHHLKTGDSLLGLHDLRQLLELRMDPTGERQLRLFGQRVREAVEEAVELRRLIAATPVRDIRDVADMAELEAEARQKLAVAETLADALVGIVFAAGSDREAEDRLAVLATLADEAAGGNEEVLATLRRRAAEDLARDAPDGKPRRPFHWHLAFPEVFQRENGGFDAFVGNPPFLGGKRISTVMGPAYNEWLVAIHAGASKNADLVAHFFRRAFVLLRTGGHFGLLATNTIAEGDTRQSGLEWLLKHGAVIHAAYPNEPWPGSAAVVTSRVHVRKGTWQGEHRLSGRPVPFISPFLSDREEWTPKRLKANEGIAFQGSIVLGMGFVLTPEEAERMLDADPKNADVIFPYLNGQDLNSDPEQRPSRWVINFWDWPAERAREYELPWRWIEERVKPERLEKSKSKSYRNIMSMWWRHWNVRPELYHAIGRGHTFERHPDGWDPATKPMERVLVCSLVQNYLKFAFSPNDRVFAHKLAVFAYDQDEHLAFLSSSIHQEWVRSTSSTMGFAINYSPSDSFLALVIPDLQKTVLRRLGGEYDTLRRALCLEERIGLTKLYNRFHDPDDRDPRLEELRELHREIDVAVARVYGWDDLDLGHGFHEVPYLPEKDRVRFTISEPARIEVLRGLAELNRRRYEEEVERGLHTKGRGKKAGRQRTPRKASRKAAAPPPGQTRLDFGTNAPAPSNTAHDAEGAILAYLRAHPGWHAKRDVLAATGLTDGAWNTAIRDLVARGQVERQGEKRGTRYRLNDKVEETK